MDDLSAEAATAATAAAAAAPSREVALPEACREEGEPRSGVDFPAEEEEEAPSFFSEEELLEPVSDEGGKGKEV